MLFNSLSAQLKFKDGALIHGNITSPSFYSTLLYGWDQLFYVENGRKYIHFQLGTSSPRISGTNNMIVFYEWQNSTYQDIQIRNSYQYSDVKGKANIKPVDRALDKILSLNPVTYDWKNTQTKAIRHNKAEESRKEIGFIAQEVEEVLPDVVMEDEEGNKLINYTAFTPVMAQSIKELAEEVEKLKETMELLKEENELLKANSGNKDNKILSDDKPILYANTPNPFSVQTNIGYYLPRRSTEKANIYIFNMTGDLKLNKPIKGTGEGSIIVNAYELNPGLYMYSLVVGNKIISTKRMVVTK